MWSSAERLGSVGGNGIDSGSGSNSCHHAFDKFEKWSVSETPLAIMINSVAVILASPSTPRSRSQHKSIRIASANFEYGR